MPLLRQSIRTLYIHCSKYHLSPASYLIPPHLHREETSFKQLVRAAQLVRTPLLPFAFREYSAVGLFLPSLDLSCP